MQITCPHQMPGPHMFDNATLGMEFDDLSLDKKDFGCEGKMVSALIRIS